MPTDEALESEIYRSGRFLKLICDKNFQLLQDVVPQSLYRGLALDPTAELSSPDPPDFGPPANY